MQTEDISKLEFATMPQCHHDGEQQKHLPYEGMLRELTCTSLEKRTYP